MYTNERKVILYDNNWKRLILNNNPTDYLIKNDGTLISLITGKKMKTFKNKKGYIRVGLTINNKQRKFFLHRLVGKMFVEGYNKKLFINHKNGNKEDNHYTNLEWVTTKENEAHSILTGLKPKGDKHWNVKYNENIIKEVCALLVLQVPYSEIVKKTGVDLTVVYDIKNKKSWSYISDNFKIPSTKLTKYSNLHSIIIDYFDKGFKCKEILKFLGKENDKTIKSLINRLRYNYLKKV